MVNLDQLKKAQTITEFRKKLEDERKAQYVQVEANQLKIDEKGRLVLQGVNIDPLTLEDDALKDLAKLGKIPVKYFAKLCTNLMKSFNFNKRLQMETPCYNNLEIKISESKVLRVQRADLLRTSYDKILDTVLNETPKHINFGDLRVVNSKLNGILDISIVSPTTNSEPRKGDVVCYGVNLIEMEEGAVQVGTAILQLACSNGAITKVCSGQEKIRRPSNDPSKENTFHDRIKKQTREAWQQWDTVAKGLQKLTEEVVDNDFIEGVILRLQQRPFFISKGLATAIKERVKREARRSTLTMFEIWDALTFYASHPEETRRPVPWQYLYRLRLGAGTMARSSAHICPDCKQLVISEP